MLAPQNSKKNINGILLLNKDKGLTSNAALQLVKKLYQAKRAGHTGSLDPIATGMLPICFGEATKFSQFLLNADKNYLVTAQLGCRTTTGDSEGEVVARKSFQAVTMAQLQQVLSGFTGQMTQTPPMFSALKHQGQPLYLLARQGITVAREPRDIYIYSLEFLSFNEAEGQVSFTLHCSKGTYVRTLVDDMGELLGCGAHVINLCRTAVAAYAAFPMHSMASLIAAKEQHGLIGLQQLLLATETAVAAFPAVTLSNSAIFYMRMGQPVRVTNSPSHGLVRLLSSDNQEFLGMGEMLADCRVQPKRIMETKVAKT